MQSFNTLWFYIGGSVAAAIVILLIAWYFCKLRRAGDVHFSVLFQRTLSLESKSRDIFIRIFVSGQKMLNCRVFFHICICFDNNYKFRKYHVTLHLRKFKLYCHYTEILLEFYVSVLGYERAIISRSYCAFPALILKVLL